MCDHLYKRTKLQSLVCDRKTTAMSPLPSGARNVLTVQYIVTFFTKETLQFRVLFPGLLSGFWTFLPIFPKVCLNS